MFPGNQARSLRNEAFKMLQTLKNGDFNSKYFDSCFYANKVIKIIYSHFIMSISLIENFIKNTIAESIFL